MRFRWPRYLPKFPAVLLIPVILGWWFISGIMHAPPGVPPGLMHFVWEFPRSVVLLHTPRVGWLVVNRAAFVLDVATFLAAGYIAAMSVDRLLFPLVREIDRMAQGQEDLN